VRNGDDNDFSRSGEITEETAIRVRPRGANKRDEFGNKGIKVTLLRNTNEFSSIAAMTTKTQWRDKESKMRRRKNSELIPSDRLLFTPLLLLSDIAVRI